MRLVSTSILALALASTAPGSATRGATCPPDSVPAGTACVDRYEASVWQTTDKRVVKRIRKGKVRTVADLAGAIQRGASGDDYEPGCPDHAAGCVDLYAVSVPGVLPAGFTTWFQAVAFCRNAGKRLATNQEWTMAMLGTPDSGASDDGTSQCNISSEGPVAAGSRSACVSDAGAFDGPGNLSEWVADWRETSSGFACGQLPEAFGNDRACSGGATEHNQLPYAMTKGGTWASLTIAGAYATIGAAPVESFDYYGFRCAR
jgi:hypothetical protein